MSVQKILRVLCDVDGCGERFSYYSGSGTLGDKDNRSPSEVRSKAKWWGGWLRENGSDYCHAHTVNRSPVIMCDAEGNTR